MFIFCKGNARALKGKTKSPRFWCAAPFRKPVGCLVRKTKNRYFCPAYKTIGRKPARGGSFVPAIRKKISRPGDGGGWSGDVVEKVIVFTFYSLISGAEGKGDSLRSAAALNSRRNLCLSRAKLGFFILAPRLFQKKITNNVAIRRPHGPWRLLLWRKWGLIARGDARLASKRFAPMYPVYPAQSARSRLR